MDLGAPAVIDAIHDAIGAWITELPATPGRVLEAIREREEVEHAHRAEGDEAGPRAGEERGRHAGDHHPSAEVTT
jgi:hypothetical protein